MLKIRIAESNVTCMNYNTVLDSISGGKGIKKNWKILKTHFKSCLLFLSFTETLTKKNIKILSFRTQMEFYSLE